MIYVGKAVDLRARLASYRRPGGDGRLAVRFLERDARAVETIVTRTESEALLLEDTLIKQHRPVHNVRLKDDKSFLMLRLDRGEAFPRLKLVRAHSPRAGKPGGRSRFFGPYASARSVRRTLADLHRIVPLRDCPDSVMKHRSRPCLKHQIGQCCAPCVEGVTAAEYDAHVARAVRILSGDTEELERDLDRRMRAASDALEFERAALWRDRLGALRRTVEGQGVRPRDRVRRDVLGLARRGGDALVHRLAFRDGRMSESRSHRFRSELPDEELLHDVVTAFYGTGHREVPSELVLPCRPAAAEMIERALGKGFEIIVPTGGERRRMLDLAGENARAELARLGTEDVDGAELIEQVRRLLDLEQVPEVIDCFDVSNTQASHAVASRVRFRRAIADRAGYRRFKLRELDGQDDLAAMGEVVRRSLRRGVDEADLPDLVVVDGGRAQLDCALTAREETGAWSVAMVGLAKARPARGRGAARREATEERLFLPGVDQPLELPRHSAVRYLFERVRNEAHRFAITYHRKERGRIQSRLDAIPGVGSVRRRALLRRFGSVGGVEAASVEQIAGVPGIGAELAQAVREHLRGG